MHSKSKEVGLVYKLPHLYFVKFKIYFCKVIKGSIANAFYTLQYEGSWLVNYFFWFCNSLEVDTVCFLLLVLLQVDISHIQVQMIFPSSYWNEINLVFLSVTL